MYSNLNNNNARSAGNETSLAGGIICFTMSLLLAFPPAVMAQISHIVTDDKADGGNSVEFTEYLTAKARLDKMFGLLTRARSQLDRTTFDQEAVLDELEYDAGNIIKFVKNDIRFEQYAGLLRGPAGTLMSRGGNALDQSVLLAKLLNDSGFEARIAVGSLTFEQANLLFQAVMTLPLQKNRQPVSTELIDTMRELNLLTDTPNEVLNKAIDGLRNTFKAVDSTQYSRISASAHLIESKMKAAMPGFATPQPQTKIVQEAQDYYWVQYREEPSQPWQDIHVALPDSQAFEASVKASSYMAGSVPDELQHQVRFTAKIEQSFGGKKIISELMTPWQRPAANMTGVPLTYTNHPDSLKSPDDYLNLRASLGKAQMFFPTFNGTMPAGTKAFDDKGRLIDPLVASNQAAGVFKSLADSMGEATSEFGGGEPMRLTKHWLEFTLIHPDGSTQTFERTIFDARFGPRLDPQQLATRLSQEHTFMVSTGDMPGDYALDQVLRRIESSQLILQAVLERSYFPQKPLQLSQQDLKQVVPQWWGHYLLYPSFASADEMGATGQLYVSAPRLVMYSEDPPIGEGQRRTIDIISDQRRALHMKDGVVHHTPLDLVVAGVWDTAMEGQVLSEDGKKSLDTFVAMKSSDENGTRVILPKDAQTVADLGLETQTLENLRRDLEMGYAVILPDIAPASIQGWWRVDPTSGETLGMLYTGQGSDFTEALSLISGIISFAFWLNGMAGCVAGAGSSSSLEFSCCVAVNSAFWIGGGIVGAYAGVAGVMASLGAFAGDMAYNLATSKLDLCGS